MDSFWKENSKLSDEEIDKKFNPKTATSLKTQKKATLVFGESGVGMTSVVVHP